MANDVGQREDTGLMTDLTREEAKALRAELAKELAPYPASLDPNDIARYRQEAPARPVRRPGYDRNKWAHLKEEQRRRDVEAAGRAAVCDLYDDGGLPKVL